MMIKTTVATLFALTLVAPLGAQIPNEFTNLQVLPPDITRPELVGVMRGYASALGVRCTYCHTVSPNLQGPNDDFAADTKATKRTARIMMAMVSRINGDHLADVPTRDAEAIRVSCATCHGGLPKPVSIQSEVLTAIDEEGPEAAVARYRALREDYFGRRAYDFGVPPLNDLGERLLAEGDFSSGIALLEMAVEFYPESAQTLFTLGQMYEGNEDPEGAARTYQRIIDLSPSLQFVDFYKARARERLDAIGR